MASSSQSLQELCVLGYIRENCTHCSIPDELQRLCTLMYVTIKDKWQKLRCSEDMDISSDGYRVSISENRNSSDWINAFGEYEIRKGQCNEWRFRVYQGNKSEVAIFIGIMETNAIRNDLASFFASHQIKGGYAYYGWNGTTYYSNEEGSESRCCYE